MFNIDHSASPLKIWLNGHLLPEEEALLPAFSQGLLWGRGLFETIAVRDGRALALTRHLHRFRSAAAVLALELPDLETLRAAIAQVLAPCPPGLHRLRLTLTGAGHPGLSLTPGPGHLLIRCQPVVPPPATAHLLTVPWRRNEHSPLAGIKTTSYAENALALHWAQQRGATEALFLNTAGHLCEGATSNLFLLHEGTLLTPHPASGCLPGITRQLVLELAARLNLHCQQIPLTPDHLSAATSLFLTSSLHGITPLSSCDARVLPGRACPLTTQLENALHHRLSETPDP